MIDTQSIMKHIKFTGKNKFVMKQTPEEERFLQFLDECIDKGITEQEQETGEHITLTEGDRYKLRWLLIRDMLIDKGMDPAELDAMEEATKEAAEAAIQEHEKRVSAFKVIK